MQVFAANYKKAATERERLLLCIEAIDQRIVDRDKPIQVIDELFGTDFRKKIPPKNQPTATGVVHFGQEFRSPSEDTAGSFAGWYLAVEFDYRGKIQKYYLSNLHK